MKIGLIGGKEIKKYTLADYLWMEIGKIAEQEISFSIYALENKQAVECFWHQFEEDNNFIGFNIALPWKQHIVTMVSKRDKVKKEVRLTTMNVIYKSFGEIIGENVDVLGIEKAIDAKGGYADKNILILGGGGVGLPTALHLAHTGAHKVYLFDINRKDVRFEKVQILESFYEISRNKYEIIINATPQGKFYFEKIPQYFCSPISAKLLRQSIFENSLIVELNYLPVSTELLEVASVYGLNTITGVEILVRQAVESFFLYTGKKVSDTQLNSLISKMTDYSTYKEHEILKQPVFDAS